MQHITLQEGEVAIKGPKDMDFVWFIVVKGRCDMMLKTEKTGKYYPIRAFEEGDTFAFSYLKMLTGENNAHEVGDIRAREPNTSLVRVHVEEEHRGDFRSQTKPLLYEELAKYFNMAADQAADRLGLCMSAIKKICRRHGIIRWPHRKLLSANKSLALIDQKMQEHELTPQGQSMLRHEAIGVLVSKLRVMLNPTYLVNSELVQVQPSAACGQQAAGRIDDMFELEGSLSPNSDGENSDADSAPASGAKRKKNAKPPTPKEAKEKKARPNEQAQAKTQMDHRAGAAAGKGADNGRGVAAVAWKQEGVGDKKNAGILAVLAGLPTRPLHVDKKKPIGTIGTMGSMQLPESSSAQQHASHASIVQQQQQAADKGANGAVDLNSIEYLSNMVRASLEKVPANVRDQVLSSVITGMHTAPAWSTHAGVLAGAAHGQAAQRPQGAVQALPVHMPASPYAYMQIPNLMQHGHVHQHQHYAHQHMAANQSLQANHIAHVMPKHAIKHVPPNDASQQGLLQPMSRYNDVAALVAACDATRNDESSDEEAAPASASGWALPDQRLNGHAVGL